MISAIGLFLVFCAALIRALFRLDHNGSGLLPAEIAYASLMFVGIAMMVGSGMLFCYRNFP